MKIREKLFAAFGLYIFLAAVLGFLGYRDINAITKKLMLVEVADDLTNSILEVRRYEKNYLLYKDKDSLRELRQYLQGLRASVDSTEGDIIKGIGRDDYGRMKLAMHEYERTMDRIVENAAAQDELMTTTRDLGRNIEARLNGGELQKFLVVRRHEKNLLLYKDRLSYRNFTRAFSSLKADPDIEQYRGLAKKLYGFFGEERDTIEKMRTSAREIQSLTKNLSRKEREQISAILAMSSNLLFMSFLTVIILGTIVNMRLSRSIADPIRRLEGVTKKIAQGDFSEAIEVKGMDEIASLEGAVNQMEEKLQYAMSSLEKTIEMLQEKQVQLVEAEKLASIGRLAAGIAHEINNPLTSVLTFSSLMLEQTPADDPRSSRLKMIVRETTRARNIVRHVLNFAREAPLKLVMMDVNRPVGEIIDSLAAQGAFEGIDLTTDLQADLPEVSIDPVQIGQVVMNMLLNAVHAIDVPGKIHVVTRLAGGFVEMVFADTGKGIAGENLKKIFDPFFTTKDQTKGTGLGLAVSYGIIKKHGGDIEVVSVVGEGTTFTVRLPVSGEPIGAVLEEDGKV